MRVWPVTGIARRCDWGCGASEVRKQEVVSGSEEGSDFRACKPEEVMMSAMPERTAGYISVERQESNLKRTQARRELLRGRERV